MDEATASEQAGDQNVDQTAGTGDESNADNAANVQAPEFEDLETSKGSDSDLRPSLDIVMDVPVTLSLEVGRAKMSVGELLKLGQGAVVELDRAVGEPLDVMVNGALVAHGEIVLVNEKFGIRLTSVVDPSNRRHKEAS